MVDDEEATADYTVCVLSLDAASLICVASYLDASELLAFGLTSRLIGWSQGDGADDDGGDLSIAEETALQHIKRMTEEESDQLPYEGGQSFLELFHELLMLRSDLRFGQLIGTDLVHGDDRGASVRQDDPLIWCAALCSDHVMRAGRHHCQFSVGGNPTHVQVGLMRPIRGWDAREDVQGFNPLFDWQWDLQLEWSLDRRAGDGEGADCLFLSCGGGTAMVTTSNFNGDSSHFFLDGFGIRPAERRGVESRIGMCLDLDEGKLSICTVDNESSSASSFEVDDSILLQGVYCWAVFFRGVDCNIEIMRGNKDDDIFRPLKAVGGDE